jgi:hypothetical protein
MTTCVAMCLLWNGLLNELGGSSELSCWMCETSMATPTRPQGARGG